MSMKIGSIGLRRGSCHLELYGGAMNVRRGPDAHEGEATFAGGRLVGKAFPGATLAMVLIPPDRFQLEITAPNFTPCRFKIGLPAKDLLECLDSRGMDYLLGTDDTERLSTFRCEVLLDAHRSSFAVQVVVLAIGEWPEGADADVRVLKHLEQLRNVGFQAPPDAAKLLRDYLTGYLPAGEQAGYVPYGFASDGKGGFVPVNQ